MHDQRHRVNGERLGAQADYHDVALGTDAVEEHVKGRSVGRGLKRHVCALAAGELENPGRNIVVVDDGFEVLCGPEKKKQIKILVTPVKELLEK